MRAWIRFFLGTPQRFLWTLGVLGILTVIVFPGLLGLAAGRLQIAVVQMFGELSPLVGPLLYLGILLLGLRFFWRAIAGR